MKVHDVMTSAPATCRPDEPLTAAAKVLWDRDCGAVPVVDGDGRPVGVLTDRDCCMAVFTRGRRLDEIEVAQAMAQQVFTVAADAPIADALATMRDKQVRRLPVVDAGGRLCGVVSLADVARAGRGGPPAAALAQALAAISAPRDGAMGKTVLVPAAPPVAGTTAKARKPRARARKK